MKWREGAAAIDALVFLFAAMKRLSPYGDLSNLCYSFRERPGLSGQWVCEGWIGEEFDEYGDYDFAYFSELKPWSAVAF